MARDERQEHEGLAERDVLLDPGHDNESGVPGADFSVSDRAEEQVTVLPGQKKQSELRQPVQFAWAPSVLAAIVIIVVAGFGSKQMSEIGIDVVAFRQCLDTGKFTAKIRKDLADGRAAGVTSTPAFFIGRAVPGTSSIRALETFKGAKDYDQFKQRIEALLTKTTATGG